MLQSNESEIVDICRKCIEDVQLQSDKTFKNVVETEGFNALIARTWKGRASKVYKKRFGSR